MGELAYHAKVSRPYISQLEAGKLATKKPSLAHLAAVARALDVDPYEWMREVNPRLPETIIKLRQELTPDVIEVALMLQSLPPERRTRAIEGCRVIVRMAEEGARQYPASEAAAEHE